MKTAILLPILRYVDRWDDIDCCLTCVHSRREYDDEGGDYFCKRGPFIDGVYISPLGICAHYERDK